RMWRLILMDLNNLNWYIEFLEVKPTGPEAGMNGVVKVYSCFADLYEPTQKDVQLGNLETTNNSVRIKIRNDHPQFTPSVKQELEIRNGIHKDMKYNIKNGEPYKTRDYLKAGGEEQLV